MIDRRRVLRYSTNAADRARELRKQMTIAEALLWPSMKGRALRGYDFHRQKPIGNFIVDFFCARLMLAVEIDGDSHLDREAEDLVRQRILEGLGITFLRFDDGFVRQDPYAVVVAIQHWIQEQEATEGSSG